MAKEIQCIFTPGQELYSILLSQSGQIWSFSGGGGGAFQVYASGGWSGFTIRLSGFTSLAPVYLGDMPVAGAGVYNLAAFTFLSGAIPTENDTNVGIGNIEWNGTSPVPLISRAQSGLVPASGAFVVTAIASGTVYLSSGQAVSLNSGQSVLVYSGQLSGQPITLLSGLSYTASGIFAVASVTINSGTLYPAPVTLASGESVLVYSGQLSGQPITLLSGLSYIASGHSTVSTLYSGQSVLPYSGQLSGQLVALLSGVNYVANMSGQVASVLSGTVWLGSGHSAILYSGQTTQLYSGQQVITNINNDKSGYILSNSGLDLVIIETGMHMRQAQSVIAASVGGQLSGAGTATFVFQGANASGTPRITATVDSSGNRSAITLSLPS